MEALIKKLTAAKVALKPMSPGSRQRPSGQMLAGSASASGRRGRAAALLHRVEQGLAASFD
jgi:hypothetical protein